MAFKPKPAVLGMPGVPDMPEFFVLPICHTVQNVWYCMWHAGRHAGRSRRHVDHDAGYARWLFCISSGMPNIWLECLLHSRQRNLVNLSKNHSTQLNCTPFRLLCMQTYCDLW